MRALHVIFFGAWVWSLSSVLQAMGFPDARKMAIVTGIVATGWTFHLNDERNPIESTLEKVYLKECDSLLENPFRWRVSVSGENAIES